MTTTAVKERAFNARDHEVRAILSGQKTQTRLIMKPQPPNWIDQLGYTAFTPSGSISGRGSFRTEGPAEMFFKSPYGKPGDRLWVRETWQKSGLGWGNDLPVGKVHYRATDNGEWKSYWGNWKPSIHMPRWASRLTLEITEVRVERLHSISESDCWDEGIEEIDGWLSNSEIIDMAIKINRCIDDARPTYACLWESIHGKGSWDANPWLWVVSFRRLEPSP